MMYGAIVMVHADYWTDFQRLKDKYRSKHVDV